MNPSAVGGGGIYLGLFQIWIGHGFTNLLDPATNIAAAYQIYRSSGPGAWPVCSLQ